MPLNPLTLKNALTRAGNPAVRIHLHLEDYASLRHSGRQEPTFEVAPADEWRQGHQARIFGVEVYSRRNTVPAGQFALITHQDGDHDLAPEWNPRPDQLHRLEEGAP